jgi:thiol-disulfide isomerase/thioredoxin
MSKSFLLTFIFSLYFTIVYSQNNRNIELLIDNAPAGVYMLKKIKGAAQITVGEALLKDDKLVFEGNYEAGLYGVLKDKIGISFIINEPDINIKIDWKNSNKVFEPIQTKENKYWVSYLKKRDEIFNKINLLHPITVGYDKNTSFYEAAKNELIAVQKQLKIYLESVPKSTLAYQYIQADLRPNLAYDRTFQQQKEDLKRKWFDALNWQEERLVNSDILSNKIDDFMGLFANRSLSPMQQETAFKKGIDMVLSQSKVNPVIHEFVLSYLVEKLEQYGMEKVLLHIAKQHVTDGDKCEKESSVSEIISRLKKYELLQIGKIAPSIESANLEGKKVQPLSTLSNKNLLIFWSSQCGHCRQMMPNLQKWYKEAEKSGWQLITISLDREKQDLLEAVKDLNLDIPIYTDYEGWKSKVVLDYNVNATPAMFVLDKDRKIMGKPNWIAELKKFD